MSVESKRACGFRKVNALYLCGDGPTEPCDRLPFPLDVCPTCHAGIKQTRGWTWIDAPVLLGGAHVVARGCMDFRQGCMVCDPVAHLSGEHKGGLLWIGEQFYKTPAAFLKEAREMGVSRRITAVPRNFKVGETVVMFAHPKAVTKEVEKTLEVAGLKSTATIPGYIEIPGIFQVFKPNRIEKILADNAKPEEIKEWEEKGCKVVLLPHGDKDHQGTVYDDDEEPAQAALC